MSGWVEFKSARAIGLLALGQALLLAGTSGTSRSRGGETLASIFFGGHNLQLYPFRALQLTALVESETVCPETAPPPLMVTTGDVGLDFFCGQGQMNRVIILGTIGHDLVGIMPGAGSMQFQGRHHLKMLAQAQARDRGGGNDPR